MLLINIYAKPEVRVETSHDETPCLYQGFSLVLFGPLMAAV